MGRATCRRPPSHAAGPPIIVRRWRPTASPHPRRARHRCGAAAASTAHAVDHRSTPLEAWPRPPGRGRLVPAERAPDRGECRELVDRAVAAGYGAVVVTVDLPMPGNRERDQRNGFVLPLGAHLPPEQPTDETGLVVLPTLDWRELDWLRSVCPVPLLAKGILRADDAARAVDAGCDGIWVSNHGGRQLDTAIAAIDALPQMRRPSGRACWWSTAVRRGIDSSRAGARRGSRGGRPPRLWGPGRRWRRARFARGPGASCAGALAGHGPRRRPLDRRVTPGPRRPLNARCRPVAGSRLLEPKVGIRTHRPRFTKPILYPRATSASASGMIPAGSGRSPPRDGPSPGPGSRLASVSGAVCRRITSPEPVPALRFGAGCAARAHEGHPGVCSRRPGDDGLVIDTWPELPVTFRRWIAGITARRRGAGAQPLLPDLIRMATVNPHGARAGSQPWIVRRGSADRRRPARRRLAVPVHRRLALAADVVGAHIGQRTGRRSVEGRGRCHGRVG